MCSCRRPPEYKDHGPAGRFLSLALGSAVGLVFEQKTKRRETKQEGLSEPQRTCGCAVDAFITADTNTFQHFFDVLIIFKESYHLEYVFSAHGMKLKCCAVYTDITHSTTSDDLHCRPVVEMTSYRDFTCRSSAQKEPRTNG